VKRLLGALVATAICVAALYFGASVVRAMLTGG
jgi:hypothetical protein